MKTNLRKIRSPTNPFSRNVSPLTKNGGAIQLSKILVPIDFSPESEKSLRYAANFVRQFGAHVTLVHVVEPIFCQADYGYGPVPRQFPNKERIKRAKTKLGRLGEKKIGARWLADPIVRSGIPFFEITEAAKAIEADLIILGTHGVTGLARTVMGSTAEKVVRHAPCPVLVVRRKEHEFVI